MAATNFDHNMYYMQFPVNGPNYNVNSCKIEVSHPQERHFPMVVSPHQNTVEAHKVLISNNTYYGHHQLDFSTTAANEEIRPMDCEMMPISSPRTPEISFGRKRSGRDVSFANIKRVKQEDFKKRETRRHTGGEDCDGEKKTKEKDLLFNEELLEGIHGCCMFQLIKEKSVL